MLVKGCGKTGATGGCSQDAAPAGSKITGPASLDAPFINSGTCYPAIGFTVTDKDNNPLNGICVEIFSDANIAIHSGLPNCSNVAANPQSSLTAKTDDFGVISLEMLTGPTPTGGTHFVSVVSGAINATATTAGAQ
jgi:hypothetical protein